MLSRISHLIRRRHESRYRHHPAPMPRIRYYD
jgi:hypothetical protein